MRSVIEAFLVLNVISAILNGVLTAQQLLEDRPLRNLWITVVNLAVAEYLLVMLVRMK